MADEGRQQLITRLCELMDPGLVRENAPDLSNADLRGMIAACEAQQRRYADAGFQDQSAR